MDPVFADAFYYIALLLRNDEAHERANVLKGELGNTLTFTSDTILVELLAFVSGLGPKARLEAVQFVTDLREDPSVRVVPQTRDLFDRPLDLYRRRPDKGYSLTDCMSMIICADLSITRVLSHDRHFQQEGLTVLL